MAFSAMSGMAGESALMDYLYFWRADRLPIRSFCSP
jgi:hypothetical protein